MEGRSAEIHGRSIACIADVPCPQRDLTDEREANGDDLPSWVARIAYFTLDRQIE